MVDAAFPEESSPRGEFVRQQSHFRQQVEDAEGAKFRPAAGRYHLYVSLACPWAHRIVIARRLFGLEEAISMSVVDPIRDEKGWRFGEGEGYSLDPVNDFAFLSEAYLQSDPDFEGRVTVPVLWDREHGCIVNNESAELLRMLNGPFRALHQKELDLYPEQLRGEIDAINEDVYNRVNNGVYRAGFATTQEAYAAAVTALFAELAALDLRLGEQRYLCGDRLTEADLRLFTTLVRFDVVYVGHFKCNLRRIADYANLGPYLRDLYQTPGFGETVDFDHIKRHYYVTHTTINPTQVVPEGPELDLASPHGRG